MLRHIRKILHAVFPGHQVSSSPAIPRQSPALTAEPDYIHVSVADAVSELCKPTGDITVDVLHSRLIDLIQRGFVISARDRRDGVLKFALTDTGRRRVRWLMRGE